ERAVADGGLELDGVAVVQRGEVTADLRVRRQAHRNVDARGAERDREVLRGAGGERQRDAGRGQPLGRADQLDLGKRLYLELVGANVGADHVRVDRDAIAIDERDGQTEVRLYLRLRCHLDGDGHVRNSERDVDGDRCRVGRKRELQRSGGARNVGD